MKDNRQVSEEKALDMYLDKLEKKEIEVPDALEAKILNRIDKVELEEPMSKRAVQLVASIAVIFTLFIASVKWVPGFAAYASGIPIVKHAVEWIKGDSGTEVAKKEGYAELDPVTIEEKGYKLVFDHIMLDEDRLVMSVYVYGDLIENLLADKEISEPLRIYDEPQDKPEPHLSFQFPDFEEGGFTASRGPSGPDAKVLEIRVEKSFQAGEVKSFLDTKPDYLTLSADLMVQNIVGEKPTILEEFKNIKIPLDPNKIKLSIKFKVDKTVKLEQTEVFVEKLIISPTRMRVDVSLNLPEGYFFTGFENPYLKDDKGNIYKAEGLVSRTYLETARSLFFVPSVYFDESHEKLYFGFDGIRIGAEEGKSFVLSMKDSYPKTISYMGEEIIIEEVTYDRSRDIDPLMVKMRLPKVLSIQGIEIEGAKGQSHGRTSGLDENGKPFPDFSGVNIEYREEYEVELSFPGYLIKLPQEIPIQLK